MAIHQTEHISVNGLEAEIDVELAALILEFWRAGIVTANSCQENSPGTAWIEFLTAHDASKFLNVVSGVYDDDYNSLYNRIRQAWRPNSGPVYGLWCFDTRPSDFSVNEYFVDEDTIDEVTEGPPDFVLSISVRFPRSDIAVLEKRMRNFNEQVAKD